MGRSVPSSAGRLLPRQIVYGSGNIGLDTDRPLLDFPGAGPVAEVDAAIGGFGVVVDLLPEIKFNNAGGVMFIAHHF